jgi:IstB-like ATP binding protein
VILTSNRGFDTWSEFLGDEVVAASVLDRFLHFATVFTHSGESYRLKEAKRRRPTGKKNRAGSSRLPRMRVFWRPFCWISRDHKCWFSGDP